MSDALDLRRALAAHLEYYRDLGVAGIRRDRIWAGRQVSPARKNRAPRPEEAAQEEVPQLEAATVESESPPTSHLTAGAGQSPAAAGRDPQVELTGIRTDLGDCTRCKLCRLGRQQIVYGVGNPDADLMFVGEAPGQEEDIQGEPFVGRAGQLLTKIIEAIGLRREDVYIANVIKCRPPGNRNPEPDEVASCEPFLFRQIDAIQPRVIVALGTFAAQSLLKTNTSISKLRGRTYLYRGAQLIATFHPAFLLRSPERKRDTWEDMKKVRAILRGEDE